MACSTADSRGGPGFARCRPRRSRARCRCCQRRNLRWRRRRSLGCRGRSRRECSLLVRTGVARRRCPRRSFHRRSRHRMRLPLDNAGDRASGLLRRYTTGLHHNGHPLRRRSSHCRARSPRFERTARPDIPGAAPRRSRPGKRHRRRKDSLRCRARCNLRQGRHSRTEPRAAGSSIQRTGSVASYSALTSELPHEAQPEVHAQHRPLRGRNAKDTVLHDLAAQGLIADGEEGLP